MLYVCRSPDVNASSRIIPGNNRGQWEKLLAGLHRQTLGRRV